MPWEITGSIFFFLKSRNLKKDRHLLRLDVRFNNNNNIKQLSISAYSTSISLNHVLLLDGTLGMIEAALL